MSKYSMRYLKAIHKLCIFNKSRIAGAKDCGCFHCLHHFAVSEADYWEELNGRDMTAACPRCGIDSVIAEHIDDRVSDDLLLELNKVYFGYIPQGEIKNVFKDPSVPVFHVGDSGDSDKPVDTDDVIRLPILK